MIQPRRGRNLCLTLAALLLSALSVRSARATDDPGIAFVNVNVLPMDAETVLRAHTVVVRDGAIAAMGPAGSIALTPDMRLIDGGGTAYLMPGLADMHVHLRRSGASWLPLFLANGVTTVLNMSGTPNHLAWRDQVAIRLTHDIAMYFSYRRERRQPAARASASVQNHRSPLEMLMVVGL